MKSVWTGTLALLLAAFLAAPVAAGVAVGGFAGYNITILQDDAGSGTLYGFKAKIGGMPLLVFEPSLTFISVGDAENQDDAVGSFTQQGGSIASYGLNVNLGSMKSVPGFGFYGTGGIGTYSIKPDAPYLEDETRFGFNFGTGLVIKPAPKLDVDVSGRLIVITLDGGGSRKSVGVFAGVNYYFGLL